MQVRLKTGSEIKRRNTGTARSTSAGNTAAVSSDRSSFLDLLAEVIPANSPDNASLQGLWAQMPDAERDLLQNQSHENVARYQELIRSIARQTLDQNVRVDKLMGRGRITKTEKELSTIRILDERLQQMAILMQAPGNSAFGLLQKLAEIRGMLMDMRR
ncbi:MAG: YaaR family protein [Spirochaetia bacterium]|nr:YaaR family protein [Spirochaetia bacterium]